MANKKRAVLISCSDHYTHRLFAIDEYLRSAGFFTTYVTSDFDHSSKRALRCSVPGCVQLPARPYQKNLSLDRILSHRQYAKDVFRWLEEQEEPDLVVTLLPPNYLAQYGAAYKKRHPHGRDVLLPVFQGLLPGHPRPSRPAGGRRGVPPSAGR